MHETCCAQIKEDLTSYYHQQELREKEKRNCLGSSNEECKNMKKMLRENGKTLDKMRPIIVTYGRGE